MMRDIERENAMRTTVAIDDDVLAAAGAIAVRTNRSVGTVLSDLAHRALPPPVAGERNGVPLQWSRSRRRVRGAVTESTLAT
jgi:hypothetical protein